MEATKSTSILPPGPLIKMQIRRSGFLDKNILLKEGDTDELLKRLMKNLWQGASDKSWDMDALQ